MAIGRHTQRGLWAARVAIVGLGLLLVASIVNQQTPGLLAPEQPPGAERLGAETAPDQALARADALDEGIPDYGKGAATEDDSAVQQEVVFSLNRVAALLGWGRDEDANPEYEADADRIRVKDWRPMDELSSGVRREEGPTTDWDDSALLRAFIARFGVARTTPVTPAADIDGEMKDFVAAAAAPPDAAPAPRAPTDENEQPDAEGKATLPVCPRNGIITTTTTQESEGGEIASKIFEYSATWLVSRGVGVGWRTPLVPAGVLRALSPLFERLTLPALEQLPPSCALEAREAMQVAAALREQDFADIPSLPARFLDPRTPVVVGSGVLLPRLMASHLAALREELSLREELRLAAASVLEVCRQRLQGDDPDTPEDGDDDGERPPVSFVVVHARRAAIAPWLSSARKRPPAPLDADYFRSAMDHIRSWLRARAVTPVFVVVTDDPSWVRDNLPADGVCVQHAGDDNNAVGLAVQASCRHAILDHSAAALAALVVGPRQADAVVVAPEDVAAAFGSEHTDSWKYL